jgi:hypothetical protein
MPAIWPYDGPRRLGRTGYDALAEKSSDLMSFTQGGRASETPPGVVPSQRATQPFVAGVGLGPRSGFGDQPAPPTVAAALEANGIS